VVVIGAESTGTTTLTSALAAHYRTRPGLGRTRLIPEYGHIYTLDKLLSAQARDLTADRPLTTMEQLVWDDSEFELIAARQNQLEDHAALDTGLLLFCDTDAWTTSVWQQRYTGHVTPAVSALARPDRALYILTDHHAVPFVQDGVRDGEHLRASMTEQFHRLLDSLPTPSITVTGPLTGRITQATTAIDKVMASAFNYAEPI
jgi:nicotinamide riboside kinase